MSPLPFRSIPFTFQRFDQLLHKPINFQKLSSSKFRYQFRKYATQAEPTTPPNQRLKAKRHKLLTPALLAAAIIPPFSFYLGVWQIQRLEWKLGLIDDLEMKLLQDPIILPDIIDVSKLEPYEYRKILLAGSYAQNLPPVFIGPRVHEGEMGYQVILPFYRTKSAPPPEETDEESSSSSFLSTGRKLYRRMLPSQLTKSLSAVPESASPDEQYDPTPILVNLGFVKSDVVSGTSRDGVKLSIPAGPQVIQGMLRKSSVDKPSNFMGDNTPVKGIWYYFEVDQMVKWFHNFTLDRQGNGKMIQPVLVDVVYDEELPPSWFIERGIPLARPPKIDVRNQHFVYAVTWFSISGATAILLGFLMRRAKYQIPKFARMGK